MLYSDLIGQPLDIGDAVVMRMPGYNDICIGTVIAFTLKKVRVEYFNNWNYLKGMKEIVVIYPKSLFKIEKTNPVFVEYLLKKSG